MNAYIQNTIEKVKSRNQYEPEFIQTVEEVFGSLSAVLDKHPEYEANNILERMAEPDRQLSFRVSWIDDNGKVNVNKGYRVQFNSAIGPYKGGLRFHPSVYMGMMKFLGFEQTFKNSLTGLPIGGAKGGSDFDPRGKSDAEIMRFCQAFMTELYRHIGPDTDIPAGDIGVGAKEIGYLFGQYRRIKGNFENGVITGKSLSYGGSLIRPEATGYGAVYFTVEILRHFNETIQNKTIAISGFGNVAWGVCKKAEQLGAKVVTISGPDGFVYDEEGVLGEKVDYLLEMRASGRDKVEDYAKKYPNAKFFKGQKPWGIKADIIMPCATQNEVTMEEAKKIIESEAKYYIEVSNMSTTNDALKYLKENLSAVGPSKAANAGGVAVSALEMCQNSMRYRWTEEEVNEKLGNIMKNIHDECASRALEYGLGYDLVSGANIAAFLRVAEAMMAQGIL